MKSFSFIRSAVQSPCIPRLSWAPPFFLGAGMGTKYVDSRRPSTTSAVMPSSSKRKCRVGSRNGEFRMGLSIVGGITAKGSVRGQAPNWASGHVADPG